MGTKRDANTAFKAKLSLVLLWYVAGSSLHECYNSTWGDPSLRSCRERCQHIIRSREFKLSSQANTTDNWIQQSQHTNFSLICSSRVVITRVLQFNNSSWGNPSLRTSRERCWQAISSLTQFTYTKPQHTEQIRALAAIYTQEKARKSSVGYKCRVHVHVSNLCGLQHVCNLLVLPKEEQPCLRYSSQYWRWCI